MKGIIKTISRGLLLVPALALAFSFVAPLVVETPVGAALTMRDGANDAKGDEQPTNLAEGDGSVFKMVTNTLLFIIGAVAVIMLIIGGIRYVISQGDSTAVTNAKNTILYAVIGIVVSLLAYALVNFVIEQFTAG